MNPTLNYPSMVILLVAIIIAVISGAEDY
jgi:hypothetical protein